MFFSVLLLDCNSMDVVIGAERYDFFVGRNVVNYATANSVDVEVVRIHKSHAAEKEDASADFSKRLV